MDINEIFNDEREKWDKAYDLKLIDDADYIRILDYLTHMRDMMDEFMEFVNNPMEINIEIIKLRWKNIKRS